MSDRRPLMPKATAVWLVENTSLTFDQIAAFCGLHVLEVKGIADGDVAQGIKGLDPVTSGQLTREEIETAERDPSHELHLAEPKVHVPETPAKKGPRYTPVSRRQDRPNAVLWLLRNHPELKDSQIMRLVGTTKPTIAQIRDRTHWNAPNLTPQDPVTLGLCSQTDLDNEVKKGARRLEREQQGRRRRAWRRPARCCRPRRRRLTRPSRARSRSCSRKRRGAARGDARGGAGARLRQAQGDEGRRGAPRTRPTSPEDAGDEGPAKKVPAKTSRRRGRDGRGGRGRGGAPTRSRCAAVGSDRRDRPTA